MPYRYLICTPTKTFSNDLLRKLVPLSCCHGSQETRFSKGRSHNRHFYTSHKLNSKLPHRPHSHWFNENKQFIQNCNYFKTNYVICCFPHRRFPGNDVTCVRDYHISTVLFNDEGKKEVKNVESTKESKDDKPQKDGSTKVVKPADKAKEVGPPAKKKLSARIMDELKHYYHGFKLLFKEFRMSTRYMIDVVIFRKSLKRREIQQVIRSTFDIMRILPMIIILVIPFMEFAIPFIIKFFPGLLPSTFQPKKTDDMRLKVLKAKIEMTKNMVETIKSHPLISKKTSTAEDFANFVANVRTKGIQPTTEEIVKYSKFFEDELTLENLSRQQLQAMCRVLDLQPMGLDGFLRFSLRMKLKRLKMDDIMIKQEGVDSLTIPELQAANRERGMRALGVSEARLRSQLQQWLDLHLEKNVPASLLLFSRALYLPETLSTEEQLKESIINLPETMWTDWSVNLSMGLGRYLFLVVIWTGTLSVIGSADQRQKRAALCPAKYQVIPNHSACLEKSPIANKSGVNDADKMTIVSAHNSYRAGVNPAADLMYKMYWDDEIAMIAQKYADACKGLVHDSGRQRGIPGRFSVGQNLAEGDYDVTWQNIVKLWYDEVQHFTMNGTNNFLLVGHYTQVVSSNSILVGCGFAVCGTTRNYVCNYGPAGNMDYNNPYKAGASCSGCSGSCSGSLCDCGGKVCLNGGTMNASTCSCSCKTPVTTYVGDTCQLNCSIHTDNPGCRTYYSPSHCDQYVNVPEDCPAMCNVCPCAGIDSVGDACMVSESGGNILEPFRQFLFQISAMLFLFTVGFFRM